MGARLRVFLTSEEDKTLFNLRSADVPQKVKDRAEVIRLNAHGWYSGFCMWSKPSYTYYQRREQKNLEQTKRRGRRLSIIGLLQPLISFVYGLVIGGVNRKSYIEMMEHEAEEAEKLGRIRVIVQDNGPIHQCKEVKKLWSKWESQNLYIFFLPKYCSEMNPIELEWKHLKKDELSGKMFEDELELAYAVMDGVNTKGKRNKHSTERIKFNNSCLS